MNGDPELEALLRVHDVDAGCAAGFEVLHRYVDEELAGTDPSLTQPGLAAHLDDCPACRSDYEGLRDAVELFGDVAPGELPTP